MKTKLKDVGILVPGIGSYSVKVAISSKPILQSLINLKLPKPTAKILEGIWSKLNPKKKMIISSTKLLL